jgi:hypothetical protein
MRDPSPKEKFLGKYGSYRHVDSMIGASDKYDRACAEHIDLHPDHEEMLKNSTDHIVQGRRAENSKDPEVLDRAIKNEDKFVRIGVVFNPNAQPHHLESALNHFDVPHHVYSTAARHPNANAYLLTKLTDRNFNPNIRSHEIAYERIEKGDYKK